MYRLCTDSVERAPEFRLASSWRDHVDVSGGNLASSFKFNVSTVKAQGTCV